jgi:hypothetical protein
MVTRRMWLVAVVMLTLAYAASGAPRRVLLEGFTNTG